MDDMYSALKLFFLKLCLFDLYRMNTLPSDVTDKIYKYSHQMLYSECMKQLKLYRVHSAFNVSWDFLEYAHYCLNDVRKPCIDINNIEVSSRKLMNMICYDNSFLNKKIFILNYII